MLAPRGLRDWTAVLISPVVVLRYRGEEIVVKGVKPGKVSQELFAEITGIQYGEIEDRV